MEKPKATYQQILDAVAYCADGKRFDGECDKCPLKPFNARMQLLCTGCIGNLLQAVRDLLSERKQTTARNKETVYSQRGDDYLLEAQKVAGNRLMTFEEVVNSAERCVWLEEHVGEDELDVHVRKVTRLERDSHRVYFDGGRVWYRDYDYGETWRCWVHMPSVEDMQKSAWGDDG